jgi:opacity protein-like surface antigen
MKKAGLAVAIILVCAAAPAFAQSERGYIAAGGGFAVTPETTSGAAMIEGAYRVAPRLYVFGDFGQYHDLQPSGVQPAIDAATEQLSTTGLNATGTGRVPANYLLGGVRYELTSVHGWVPYAIGGLGFAHLSPTATFTYTNGPMPDGSTPTLGQDITSQVESSGAYVAPAASDAFMYSIGGGVQIPVFGGWAADVGYRFSRIAADMPVNAQGVTFGIGYRF